MKKVTTKKKDNSPRVHKGIENFVKKGLIMVYTGGGKGKSTAGFGAAIRAMGRGYNVAIIQFIKGNWKTGETLFLQEHKDQCTHLKMGEGFTWETKNFKQDVQTAERAFKKCCDVLNDEKYHLVIFDEINYVMHYNFLDVDLVAQALKNKPANKHVILTGNHAPRKIINMADLVTRMQCVKHPYDKGIKAQPGIDY